MISKTELNSKYSIALLLSTSKRKSFESLGRATSLSGDTIARLLDVNAPTFHDFLKATIVLFKGKRIYLLLDDTLIDKIYSQHIEGTSDNYVPGDGITKRSICSITAMFTDGNIAIPIDHAIWTSKEINPNTYMTKTDIGIQLISKIKEHAAFDVVIMDGLYATKDMIRWLISQEIKFEMRYHSNRVIVHKGMKFQIQKCPLFQLKGRRTERTIKAYWHEFNLYFTAIKRKNATGRSIITFQVSNYHASARKHMKYYGYRWNIEKFFRTGKQYLGLNDCQSRKLERQNGHIFNVFAAYIVAQFERKKQKCKNVEDAIKSIKFRCLQDPNYAKMRFLQIFFHA